ncbi:LysM peptidoglycan-binding domain-containing protein [Furfurilactobacillus siliginis]|uniref:Aggregation promoting factor-like surface protein n=1 Tax=Furfurilactobacillus siliginis TaxID=348151 RepID=A0A0R2LC71_9LACO|nr:LysM peptidoglycan-binding domain-containing protein [Furfurilactobacillus siliginis]KRN96650.1 aggregation promoting factor-like surface protein [Furfurilactobacillus siliginis]GEK28783.1 peptidase M23 [Furfurilactobacillus siliginis]
MKIKQILATTLSAGALLVAGNVVANADSNVTVKSGDTVSALALENNTTIDAIINANQLENDGNVILVGQNLIIPDGTATQTTTTQAPVAAAQPAQQTAAPVYHAQAAAPVQQAAAPAVSGSDSAAQAYIAARESGGNYNATNGQYYGKYQLSLDKLHGDLSAANQERVASQYATSRYGSWAGAQAFWQSNGWW